MEGIGEWELFDMAVKEIRRIPLMTREEEIAAVMKMRRGDMEARNRLIAANLRFVAAVAIRFSRPGLSVMDILSAGCLGLCMATRRYDPEWGVRFLTYAAYWIRQGIQRTIAADRKHEALSLDEPATVYGETTIADLLDDGIDWNDKLAGTMEMEGIFSYPGLLTDRERNVIEQRYVNDRTLDETGAALGMKKEGVRQVERRALLKVKRLIRGNNG